MSGQMKWTDLLRMSGNNLVRRRLRTFLTVLGVVIGTASIVVMVSLGIGLRQSVYEAAEESGGLTSVSVSVSDQSSGSKTTNKKQKLITDDAIKKLGELEHVQSASPVLNVSAKLQKGKYEANVQLTGMKAEALKAQNLPLVSGSLPDKANGQLNFLPGNMVIMSFHAKGSDSYSDYNYSDPSSLPDINFTKDKFFLSITESSAGQQSGSSGTSSASNAASALASSADNTKKYYVKASGTLRGSTDEWSSYSSNVYVDLDALLKALKTGTKGGVIPGQPVTAGGKPYPYLVYSSAALKVDDAKNVESVMNAVKALGYQANSNMELINSSKKQFAIIQGVLGAIGAVSLFVAAIGIANTMMMSIYERTKEIGVIKVLGCSLKNIRQMFLLEAAFIGLFGGLAGNGLSLLVSFVINHFAAGFASGIGVSGSLSVIPLWLAGAAMVFATLIGMAAGYFPALRATRLSPLAAITG